MKRGTREPRPESGGFESDIMTMQEVADYLHCHYFTLYRLVRRGAIPAFSLGGDYRFRRADIANWIAQHRVPAGESLPRKGAARGRRKS